MLGKKNYAEYLLQRFNQELPEEWKAELLAMTRPGWPGLAQIRASWRKFFMPVELFFKHRINRSRHVSVRLGH
jgi:hypothetical protein